MRSTDTLSAEQLALGDFRPGRWAWSVGNPHRLAEPILYQGNRGIFEVKIG